MIQRYFPHGGLQRDFAKVAARLVDRGHTVEAIAADWDGDPIADVPVRIVPAPGLTNHGRAEGFADQVRRAVADGRFDGVTGFNKMPGLDIYYCGDSCYRADVAAPSRWLTRLTPRYRARRRLEESVFGPAAGTEILSLSEIQQRRYMACYGTPADRFHAIPPVIDPRRRRPDDAEARRIAFRQPLGIGADAAVVLSIGASVDTKGLDRTMAAIAALPSDQRSRTHHVVLGNGNLGEIAGLAQRLGLDRRTHALGARDDVLDALCAADLLCHPARRENTGQAILEGMVAGLPVVATANCGYSPHIQRADAGIVLDDPFDQGALNAALAAGLGDDRRHLWAANGVAYGLSADLYSGIDTAASLIADLIADRR